MAAGEGPSHPIRPADPRARRQALALVVAAAVAGTLLFWGIERYLPPVGDWIVSEPDRLPRRARLVVFFLWFVLVAPQVAFAVYLWRLGRRIVAAREFPPPGFRVIHDTVVLGGSAAVSRGRALQVLACCLTGAGVLASVMLWWIAESLSRAR